ncbi:MAG TPA: hypothetical protein VGO49_22455 [Bradyrhizobium sp.]|jgi:hypothetical protein|nr:hypothetical protein [Bradyrhizobium sp.]
MAMKYALTGRCLWTALTANIIGGKPLLLPFPENYDPSHEEAAN